MGCLLIHRLSLRGGITHPRPLPLLRWQGILLALSALTMLILSCGGAAVPSPTPSEVKKLTIAVDSWGSSILNPWTLNSVSFLQDYFNLRLMMQAPSGELAPAWAVEFEQTEDGITFKLNPDAKFQDGSPADAEALQQSLMAFLGQFVGQAGYETLLWNSGRAQELIEDVQVIGPTEVFVKTPGPKPTWMWNLGGNGHHLYWYGNPAALLKGPEEYPKDTAGGGPYKIIEWEAGERILFQRWEEFWANYEHWHKPQAGLMELRRVPDGETRLALLKSEQVDAVYNLPWALAKDLVRSENFQRGINPGQGGLWTQTYQGSGILALTFACPLHQRESAKLGEEIPEWTFPKGC